MNSSRFDSLIFDMDGTLWDAVDTYCRIWNETYRRMGVEAPAVERQDLIGCMGLPIEEIVRRITPPGLDFEKFGRMLSAVDGEILPKEGGRLYPGVAELIPRLADGSRLFMVSNCGKHGLDYFLDYTGLRPWFTDTLSHGQTGLPKEGNIEMLMKRYNLKTPLYIGDTSGDCRSAHAAGIPMLHVTYGFGRCDEAEYSADSFQEVANIISNK